MILDQELRVKPIPKAKRFTSFEERLFYLWVQEIRETGQCDDPEFVELANEAYQIDTMSPGALMSKAAVYALIREVTAQVQMGEMEVQFQAHLRDMDVYLGEAMIALLGIKDDISRLAALIQCSSKGWGDETDLQLEKQLKTDMHTLHRATHYFQAIAEWYARAFMGVKQEPVMKLMNDIDYMQIYLSQHIQVSTIRREFLQGDEESIYFCTVYQYTDDLLDRCRSLVETIKMEFQF